jgi:phenylacetate-coenzyme A ligase PaaK-like adenylate-forming protein
MDQPAAKIQGYIWNPQAGQMPPAELAALQAQRLQQQVTRAYELVLFYRRALEERGVHPQDIRALDCQFER